MRAWRLARLVEILDRLTDCTVPHDRGPHDCYVSENQIRDSNEIMEALGLARALLEDVAKMEDQA